MREEDLSRWQSFAKVVALALGANLWICLVLSPSLTVGALAGSNQLPPLSLAAIGLPLLPLALGVVRRQETLLLLAFPSALLIPISLTPAIASPQMYGPGRTAIAAIALVAFLAGASTLTSFAVAPEPASMRPLTSSLRSMAPRWRRRNRLYATLSLLALVFPLALLYRINFGGEGAAAVAANYPGRAATFTILLNVVAIATWLVLLNRFFIAPLEAHRRGDKSTRREIASLRQSDSLRARHRGLFALGALTILVLSALWFLWSR